MDLILHVLEHAFEDTLPLVPFLLVTYLVLEVLEHAAGEHVNAAVRRAGAAGPVVGALLGIVPQCGFSAMGATLYAGRVITLGTLVAVFLSTSDEMLPLLVAERMEAGALVQILLVKAAVAAVTGVAIDLGLRALSHNARAHAALRRIARGEREDHDLIDEMADAGAGADHIHRLCEHDHCGCDDDAEGHGHAHGRHDNDSESAGCCSHGHAHDHHGGMLGSIVKSALSHTIQVTVFIYLVTFVLVLLLETVGEDALATFLSANEGLAVFASALVGLVPNCAASVVITQLFLEGVLGFGPLMAGTLVSAGVGFLVLFRSNHNARENAIILALLYVLGVAWGFVFMALG
ncbi:putative manganese transporter [Collinsella sp. An2]|uniref:putative manganese transporter n=1 Tax=Collinsella sp. An2 TaxID=1965585 RepID=UPI000B3727FC|nr:putative manganese transporter [Collinsella sp. An2]OUP08432.1 hypothetical protein B5F33_06940 [Collinsella sp. An2]